MKKTPELVAACHEVTRLFPNVDHLFISTSGRWFFCDDSFDGPMFTMDDLDLNLLDVMVDSIDELPASFYIPEVLS